MCNETEINSNIYFSEIQNVQNRFFFVTFIVSHRFLIRKDVTLLINGQHLYCCAFNTPVPSNR